MIAPLRLHLATFPHTVPADVPSQSWDAYMVKTRRFANEMTRRGHEAYVYASSPPAGEEHARPLVTEWIECMSPDDHARLVGTDIGPGFSFDPQHPAWAHMNAVTIHEMRQRLQPRDLILVIGGTAHRPIADAFPDHVTVEWGIGYGGTFATHRVYESYAWMHAILASEARARGSVNDADGNPLHAVIPNLFDPGDFCVYTEPSPGPYIAYVGRLEDRKGYRLAVDVARDAGMPIMLAGTGSGGHYREAEDGVTYMGHVAPAERAHLLASASLLMVPSRYLEPFGGVAVEALLSGTPVAASAWGAFPEIIGPDDGALCRTRDDWATAAAVAKDLPWLEQDRTDRRARAIARFGVERVCDQFEEYLRGIDTAE